MLKIAVAGAAGKMGKTNIKVVSEDKECLLVGALEASNSSLLGKDAGEIAGIGNVGISITSDPNNAFKDCDVIIDFTTPSATTKNIEFATKFKKAIVIGTTGIGEKEKEIIREAGKVIPVIWAPNFSVGINLMTKLIKTAAQVLGNSFDAEIVEIHHRLKKDSPSGTALQLLNVLKEIYNTDNIIYGREGMIGERPANQIGVFAVRGGDVVGEHTVSFYGIGERLEIVHKASSRETFARGALRAAKYIISKGIGLYTMNDVLGL